MKKLTSAPSVITIHHYKNILESEGISCKIRNEHLGSILGEMPFTDTWPQLWVVNDLDFDRAKQLIDGSALDESDAPDWRCYQKRLQLYWINSIVEYTGRDILKQRAVCMVQRLNCHAPIAILQR